MKLRLMHRRIAIFDQHVRSAPENFPMTAGPFQNRGFTPSGEEIFVFNATYNSWKEFAMKQKVR